MDFLSRVLHPVIRDKRIHRPLILEDNARPHKHHKVKAFYNCHRWVVLRHPPYSPDLWPPDWDGFARIKRPNKGTRFNNFEKLKTVYLVTIRNLNENKEFKGIWHFPQRWGTCWRHWAKMSSNYNIIYYILYNFYNLSNFQNTDIKYRLI